MKIKSVAVLGGLVFTVASLAGALTVLATTGVAAGPGVTARPWMNTGLPPQQRARLLVAQMTLDEKIAMVHGAGYPLPLNGAG
jgi:beta-glucosidase